jgi:hypothetical protein
VKKTLRSFGVALAMLLIIGGVSPARAGTFGRVDARHDVNRMPSFGGPYHRAPLNRKNDVTRLRVRHGKERIRFTITLRSASLKGLNWRDVVVSLRTSGDSYGLTWMKNHQGSTFDLADQTTQHVLTCRSEKDGRMGRTIWFAFNRSCVGSPRWIRASLSVGSDDGRLFYGDSALSNRWRHIDVDVYTPRIRSS